MIHMDTLGATLAKPRSWTRMDAGTLDESLMLALVGFCAGHEGFGQEAVARFYTFAQERLPPSQRAHIVTRLGRLAEAWGRKEGSQPLGQAFVAVMHLDDDETVVATAALEAAQVMPLEGDDPMTGPKAVVHVAAQVDEGRRATILSGLVTMGDARVAAVLVDAWPALAPPTRSALITAAGNAPPCLGACEFLVSVLETGEPIAGDLAGSVAGSLLRQLRVADGRLPSPYAGRGIVEAERVFPSWAVGEDEVPIRIAGRAPKEELARRFGPRLQRAAREEEYPRLVPHVLAELGVEDAAFAEAVCAAMEYGRRHLQGGVATDLLPVSVPPGWFAPDALVEWGILNPFGPTRTHLLEVPCAGGSAIVYAMHNPFEWRCFVAGRVPAEQPEQLRAALLAIAEQYAFGDYPLMTSLPHWVRVRDDVPDADGHALFARLHRRSLDCGTAPEERAADALRELRRLRKNPREEMQRQLRQAFETLERVGKGDAPNPQSAGSGASPGWTPAEYAKWFTLASSAKHREAVEPMFLECWNAAQRFQREGVGG
jgi:hypothetical protein